MHVVARQICTLNIKKKFGHRRKSSSTEMDSPIHGNIVCYCGMEPTSMYPICFDEAKAFKKYGSSRCRPSSRHRRPPSQEKKPWEFGY
mmetsp:Transcript_63193/g.86900  ORF Transcript_63193/g.86900 Transcript_63193/m.86900 type:complete len:88 (-) Transcript_63193:2651-2914(-)